MFDIDTINDINREEEMMTEQGAYDVEVELPVSEKHIHTLDELEKKANNITGHWNGSDERYVDASGEPRTDRDAQIASDMIESITELREMIEALGL